MTITDKNRQARHHVVIVGGGFAGVNVAKQLRGTDLDVTLVDRRNFHLFQPLTYQVATGALAPGDIAYPLRSLFASAANVRVVLGRVTGFDLTEHRLLLAPVAGVPVAEGLTYDTLVVATGSAYSYFGHDDWAAVARRFTFLIDPEGTVRKIYNVKDFGGHPDEVLADLERLSPQ